MTRFATIALVALLGTTAAYAEQTSYDQLEQTVINKLTSQGVATDGVGLLTMDQLGIVTGILNGDASEQRKAVFAGFVIDQMLHPVTIAMDSAEGLVMTKNLQDSFMRADMPYPKQKLDATQVTALQNVFVNYKKTSTQKDAIEAILATMDRPASEVATNPGLVQLSEQFNTKLTGLGITPPPFGSLTFEQVSKLDGVLNGKDSDSDKKAAAMQVIAPN